MIVLFFSMEKLSNCQAALTSVLTQFNNNHHFDESCNQSFSSTSANGNHADYSNSISNNSNRNGMVENTTNTLQNHISTSQERIYKSFMPMEQNGQIGDQLAVYRCEGL